MADLLQEGVIPPEQRWTWIPPGSRNPAITKWIELGILFGGMFPVTFLLLGGWSQFLSYASFSVPGDYPTSFVIDVMPAFVTVVFTLKILSQYPRRIGLGDDGVRVDTRLRPRVVPWSSLRPSENPPDGDWATLIDQSRIKSANKWFPVTRGQALAILTDRRAPTALFPPEFWQWLGRPPPSQTNSLPTGAS